MGIVVRQSLKGTGITYLGALVGFLSTFFIQTRYLLPSEIGLLQVILQAATLVSSFAMMGLNSSIYRFYPYFRSPNSKDGNKDNGFLYYTIVVALGGLAVIIPLYYLLYGPICSMYATNSPEFVRYFHWVVPLVVCLLFWLIFELYAVQLMRIAVPKLIREIVLRILLIGTFLLYASGNVSFPMMVGIYIASHGLCMLLTILYVGRISGLSMKHDWAYITPELRKNFLRYTMIYVSASIGTKLAGQLGLFMVGALDQGGMDSAGIYSIAFFMVAVVEIPSRSMLNIASPLMAEAMKKEELPQANHLFKRVALHQVLAGGIIFLLVLFNLENIYGILPNGDKYLSGKTVFLFLGIAKMLEITFNYGNSLLSCSKYYHWNLYYTFGVTALGIVWQILLIPRMGITGAAVATLLTTGLSYVIQQLMISLKLRCSPFSRDLFIALGIFALMIATNYIIPTSSNHWADLFIRSGIIGTGAMCAVYFSRISPEARSALNRFFRS
ncbi:MAG: lipopolysaccharide biosynthesis protein [Porphyromonas sp.]|nr:lipopolysaccharide biosynthesis protein [Porphyromonas sp.]